MKENSMLRAEARTSLKGNWTTSALYTFVYVIMASILAGICSAIQYINAMVGVAGSNILDIVFCAPLIYGYMIGFLHQFRGKEQQIEMLFSGFKVRIWCTMLLMYVYTFLWSLLLIIPGIIKGYSYAMTPYILNDESNLTCNAAIEKSMALMSGHKMKLFLLDLSFIGWYLLAALTLFIGCLWIFPYHQSARAAFYEDLKCQNE